MKGTVSDTPRKSHVIAEVGGSLWADEIEDIGTSEKRVRVMTVVEIVWAYLWKCGASQGAEGNPGAHESNSYLLPMEGWSPLR